MTDVEDHVPARRWSTPAIGRQPVVRPDRSVFAWALRAESGLTDTDASPAAVDQLDRAVEAEYSLLDLAALTSGRPLIVRCTPRMLSGERSLGADGVEVVLELPGAMAADPATRASIERLRDLGTRLVLGDYTATGEQDALLADVHIVKVAATAPDLSDLVARAHDAGATVIAEHADARADIDRALAAGVDLLQGPMFERGGDVLEQEFTAGELQCLELMALLSDDPVDQAAVIGLVAADPMLSVRVLHLVNSSAFGLPREIDSVRQAVVLVGPHHLSALAISSLVGAQVSTVAELWAILTRALACWDLAGSDAGYTVGLLSAVADQRHLAIESLISRTGV
ncbi:MAG: HDOD domain-containing protein, partial [Micrococcales bacterium]|nr:HDOD domain-containing protein [Micrococcales bacterium]